MRSRFFVGMGGFLAACVFAAALTGPARANERDALLEGIGLTYAQILYNSQLIVGILADAYVGGVYDDQEAFELLSEQLALLSTTYEYIGQLPNEVNLDAEDLVFVRGIKTCMERLQATIMALGEFVEDPSERTADRFEQRRIASYAAIAELLDLE